MKAIITMLVIVLTLSPLKLHASEDILRDTNISQDQNGGLQVTFDLNSDQNVKSLKAMIWSDNDESKPLCYKDVQGDNGHFYFDVQSYDNINESSTWTVSILYENGREVISEHYDLKDDINTKALDILNTDDMVMSSDVLNNVNVVNNGFTYTITAEIDAKKVTSVYFPTWTLTNGQDDITWGKGDITGNTVTYTANIKDHNYEDGEYITHIYSYDSANQVMGVSTIPTQVLQKKAPTIGDIQINNEGTKYIISAKICGMDIRDVKFPTWTDKDGQDDILWETGTLIGDSVTYTVDMKDHNYEDGEYITHIYAYDELDNLAIAYAPIQNLKKKLPAISNIEVQNTGTSYTITANVEGSYLNEVKFPTWTARNGQDDIRWETGSLNGNTVTFTVDMKNHNYEDGEYITHLYLYDSIGNVSVSAVPTQELKKKEPSITDINIEKTDIAYKITAKLDGNNITDVKFPTWTQNQWQDDISWNSGIIDGDTVTYIVNMKDHNYEDGDYITHIYIYDALGNINVSYVPVQNLKKIKPTISNINVDNTGTSYTITANVEGSYLSKAKFPTWTVKDGQDDIRWEEGMIKNGIATFTVSMKDHDFEEGDYITHLYVYDELNNSTVAAVPTQTLKKKEVSIKNIKVDNSGTKYTITANIDGTNIASAKFPTWTAKNGQDDIIWENGIISGNTISYTVDMKNHNYEEGEYITHIYIYDEDGDVIMAPAPIQYLKNEAPVISDIQISNNGEYYTITALVADDIGIDYVEFPTWTESNEQDDITWEKGSIEGGKVSYTVYPKDHNFELGNYITHIYAYDKAGKVSMKGVPSQTITKITGMASGWNIVNGKKYLMNNQGQVVAGANKLVIDISEHNGDIDWQAVKNSGVDAVILRCGYGWQNDLSQIDKKFLQNAKELERLNIPYGVYLFSYENSAAGAIEEAKYTLRLIQGRKISLPVYYDLEYDKSVGNLPQSTYVSMANAFCQYIKNAGYTPGVYANLDYWSNKLNDPSLDKYEKWVAQYNLNDGTAGHCDYTKPYKMWQYTSVGKVNGISTNVDMNALYE